MAVKIKDNTKQFIAKNEQHMDMALGWMAADIEARSKMEVPHDKGPLKASGHHRRLAPLKYQIYFNKEYAAYQHEGQRRDGTHKIRRHSKPDKKTHYLKDPAELIVGRAESYLRAAAKRITV